MTEFRSDSEKVEGHRMFPQLTDMSRIRLSSAVRLTSPSLNAADRIRRPHLNSNQPKINKPRSRYLYNPIKVGFSRSENCRNMWFPAKENIQTWVTLQHCARKFDFHVTGNIDDSSCA